MKPPIFVYEPATLDVFSTKEKAEAYMEAVDVKNGVYTAVYDSEGYVLEVTVTSDNGVAINSTAPPVKKIDELRELLETFLKTARTVSVSDEWLASASLNELVAKALEHKTW
jgi:hypothetical protein